jgi:hypothetical protein
MDSEHGKLNEALQNFASEMIKIGKTPEKINSEVTYMWAAALKAAQSKAERGGRII